MNRETRTDYGKQLQTRITNNKSASDYRVEPVQEKSLETKYDTNSTLIQENLRLKEENKYLLEVLDELRNSLNNLQPLI